MAANAAAYRWCEEVEERVAGVYIGFHEKFIRNPPLARFWMEAALEEFQHAAILRFCRERQLFSTTDIDDLSAERVAGTLEIVDALVNTKNLTIDRAFLAARILESSGLDGIFRQLVQALAYSHCALYTAIEASLQSHHEAFTRAELAFSERSKTA